MPDNDYEGDDNVETTLGYSLADNQESLRLNGTDALITKNKRFRRRIISKKIRHKKSPLGKVQAGIKALIISRVQAVDCLTANPPYRFTKF